MHVNFLASAGGDLRKTLHLSLLATQKVPELGSSNLARY